MNYSLSHYLPFLLLLFFLANATTNRAQLSTPVASVPSLEGSQIISQDLFAEETPLRMVLSFNRKTFIRQKTKGEYQEANLTLYNPDSSKIEGAIRIKARGEFRRAHCFFPPIKLHFGNSVFQEAYQPSFRTLKLVTHCVSGRSYEQYVMQEYLIYKIYNLLTPYSFRVRRVEITYLDSENKAKPITSVGFLIENINSLAKRLDARVVKNQGIKQIQLVDSLACQMAIFEFFIGNYDWKVEAQHNVKIVGSMDPFNEYKIAIPYDFDITGLVSPQYGVPHPDLNMISLRDRIYRGRCFGKGMVDSVLQKYKRLRPEIIAIYEQSEELNPRAKKESIQFLDEFYKGVENASFVKREFLKDCL